MDHHHRLIAPRPLKGTGIEDVCGHYLELYAAGDRSFANSWWRTTTHPGVLKSRERARRITRILRRGHYVEIHNGKRRISTQSESENHTYLAWTCEYLSSGWRLIRRRRYRRRLMAYLEDNLSNDGIGLTGSEVLSGVYTPFWVASLLACLVGSGRWERRLRKLCTEALRQLFSILEFCSVGGKVICPGMRDRIRQPYSHNKTILLSLLRRQYGPVKSNRLHSMWWERAIFNYRFVLAAAPTLDSITPHTLDSITLQSPLTVYSSLLGADHLCVLSDIVNRNPPGQTVVLGTMHGQRRSITGGHSGAPTLIRVDERRTENHYELTVIKKGGDVHRLIKVPITANVTRIPAVLTTRDKLDINYP